MEDLATQLDHVAGEATAALDELREITHGVHSSGLTTGGLRPALRALARRAPLPVELHVHVDGRLPEPVETGAYYTVAEALTNTAKYAHASAVTITVDTTTDTDTDTDTDNTVLRLTVHDDGVGGADLTRGTGLLGLKDRASMPSADTSPSAAHPEKAPPCTRRSRSPRPTPPLVDFLPPPDRQDITYSDSPRRDEEGRLSDSNG